MTKYYYRDLSDHIINKDRCDEILYCICGVEASANSGDYWSIDENKVILCGECGGDMQLVTKEVSYIPVN